MQLTQCPDCGGGVARTFGPVHLRLGRRTVTVRGKYERCQGECGEVFFAPGEMDAAMKKAAECVRMTEGLLTPAEIVQLRQRLDMTQHQFEQLLAVGPKTVVRWERGVVIPNGATNTLLALLRDVPEALAYVIAQRAHPTDRPSPHAVGRSGPPQQSGSGNPPV